MIKRVVFWAGVIVDATQAPSSIIWLAPWALLPRLMANKVWAFSNVFFALTLLVLVWRVWFRNFSLSAKRVGFAVLVTVCWTSSLSA